MSVACPYHVLLIPQALNCIHVLIHVLFFEVIVDLLEVYQSFFSLHV